LADNSQAGEEGCHHKYSIGCFHILAFHLLSGPAAFGPVVS
jgi:hypothetical protein